MKTVAVTGESLIDLIQIDEHTFKPMAGGSSFNVARALGLQQIPVSYLSPFSQDQLGDKLYNILSEAGVAVASERRSKLPTSLAVVTLDGKGQPSYSLYRERVADRDISLGDIIDNLPEGLCIFHTGSLALIPEDVRSTINLIGHLKTRSAPPIVCVDLNMRPLAVNDDLAYAEAIKQLIPNADLVKLSDEDLHCLSYGKDPELAIDHIYQQLGVGVVVITKGAEGCLIKTPAFSFSLPCQPVSNTVDTVGAGDCFQAGMISYLYRHDITDLDSLLGADQTQWTQCLKYATRTAAFNIQHEGCNPPLASDLTD